MSLYNNLLSVAPYLSLITGQYWSLQNSAKV